LHLHLATKAQCIHIIERHSRSETLVQQKQGERTALPRHCNSSVHLRCPTASEAQRISTCNKSTAHFHLQQKHTTFPPATKAQRISTCHKPATLHFHLQQQKHSAFPPATEAQRISTCNKSTAHFHLPQTCNIAFPPATTKAQRISTYCATMLSSV
jgi:hypothetical protein